MKINQLADKRSSHTEVFLGKDNIKLYSKFTEEHPCRSAISIKLQSKFIEITCGMGVLLEICCTFSEHLFLWKPLDDCFCDKILRVIQIWWKILTTMVLSWENLLTNETDLKESVSLNWNIEDIQYLKINYQYFFYLGE